MRMMFTTNTCSRVSNLRDRVHRIFGYQCLSKLLLLHFIQLLVDWPENTAAVSSTDLCASKVCSGCIAGSLSCQEGGLSSLPDELTKDIQSVIFIGHQFDNNELSRENFSSFPHQTKQLQRLTIRNCGIQHVEPGTFQTLPNITQLDLSQNKLTLIEPGTFVGLKLELLRLDENKGLHLSPGAFGDTSIVSLSMNHCDLRSLTYEDLLPLFQTGTLANLHLTGNKLFTLESRLEPIMLGLQSLSIEQNPFHCDCKAKWMVSMLQKRANRRTIRGLELLRERSVQNKQLLPSDLDIINNVPLDGDTLKPLCRAPERLFGRPIEKLSLRDFYCDPPRLQAIEIDLSRSKLDSTKDSQTVRKTNLEVVLRCEIKGSPELQISWYKQTDESAISDGRFLSGIRSISKLYPSNILGPGLAEIQLFPPRSSTNSRSISNANIIERFMCFASDQNGNTSIELSLGWPPQTKDDGTMHDRDPVTTHSIKVYSAVESPTAVNPSEEKAPRKNSKLYPDWYILTGDDPGGFWLQKQFSALQMIGAVVGTFAITLLLFAVGCCLIKSNGFHRSCTHSKYARRQSSAYSQSTPNNKYSAPPSYSYAPTQPNQLGLHHGANRTYPSKLHAPYSTTTNQIVQNGEELSTNPKRLQYATYEPVVASSNLHSSAYSDSQTYDLPTCPLAVAPPALPLPPVPSSGTQVGNFACNNPIFVPASVGSTVSVGPSVNGSTATLFRLNNANHMLVAMSVGSTLSRKPTALNSGQPMQLNGYLDPHCYSGALVMQQCSPSYAHDVPGIEMQSPETSHHG